MSLKVVSWPIHGTDIKRCQWVERNRRCTSAPTRECEFEFDPPAEQPRGQAVCDEHHERMKQGDFPQRWSAPESSWMWSGRGLVIYKRPSR